MAHCGRPAIEVQDWRGFEESMRWQGKVFGALVGFWLGHGPIGALIGLLLGHYLDLQVERSQGGGSADPRTVQDAFFRATFQVMGHVAKADGRVSEEEIRAARAMMGQLRLNENDVRVAIDLFTEGKARDFPLEATVSRLREVLGNRLDLRRMFMQIQLQAALWGGSTSNATRAVLLRACNLLGISEFEFAQMEALLRMQRAGAYGYGAGYGGQGAGGYSQGQTQRSSREVLKDAYSVLGVESNASDAEVTKAYRRLMSQNHPDKLAAKGLPDSMKTVAEEKTRQIRAAYEAIREARGMK